MSNKIFWYSGSGNSKYVAQRIHQSFAEAGSSELISIGTALQKENFHYDVSDGDPLGFVFPTYFWGMPSAVSDFIRRLDLSGLSDTNFVYLVLTCGGSTGMCDRMASRLLSTKGCRPDVAFSVSMPDSYCILLDLMTPREEIAPVMDGALKRIDRILSVLKELSAGKSGKRKGKYPVTAYRGESLIDRGPHPAFKTACLYSLYRYGRSTSPFHAEETCIGCGKCAEVCPVGIITMVQKETDGKRAVLRPEWKKGKCVQCLACLHHCPTESIQYGRKTKGRLRYVFPENRYPL